MSQRKLPNGVTSYEPDKLPGGGYSSSVDEWAKDTGGSYRTNEDGSIDAFQKPNFWYDKLAPSVIIGGIGAGVGNAASSAIMGALKGTGGAAATSALTDLSAAPALGSTATGVVPGVALGSAGVEALPMAAGGFGSLLKDPKLILAALSLFGGDDGPQKRQGYHGELTNPEDSLHRALSATYRAGQGMMEKKPVKLRGLLPDAPAPVSIPGLPFQIGGGMGHNPAQDDMDVDSMEGYRNYDPFQSVAVNQFADAAKKQRR